MSDYTTVQVCLSRGREQLLILSDGRVAADESVLLLVPAWSARHHADETLAERGYARAGEWVRDPWGYLTAVVRRTADYA